MKVLVTGANGMLGQDLCPTLEDLGCYVIETDVDNLDITKEDEVNNFITEAHPDLIIHIAAYTNVDKAEDEPEIAELINGKGTENLAKIAGKLDIPIIYVSTDYVFDGTKDTPYLPTDETCPISVYGKTKLMGEIAIQKYCKKFYIARTSWLYGNYGKNFVDTMLKLKDKELKVVDDQIGTPTWTMDLSSALMKLLTKPYGIYHLSGGGKPTSWYNFARTIFELSNIEANLKPCTSKEYPQKATRPKYSVMDNDKMLRDWKLALKDYLALTLEN